MLRLKITIQQGKQYTRYVFRTTMWRVRVAIVAKEEL